MGDSTLDVTVTPTATLPGAFKGGSMSCRVCHLVDEHHLAAGGGNRTYADFARLSPIPARFTAEELRGFRIFLREPTKTGAATGVGNCIACRPLPTFTDAARTTPA